MRILIHLWMVITLALGICGDDMVRRATNYEGSGMMGSGLPVTHTDDEDYSSYSLISQSESYSEMGSGDSSSYRSSESMGPIEEETNVISMIGEFRITMISGGTLDWMPDLADSNTRGYHHMKNLVESTIRTVLQAKKNTKNGLRTVKILGFRSGSVIVDYEATYDADTPISTDAVKKAVKDAATSSTFGDLTVDPKSVTVTSTSIITPTPPVDVVITDAVVTRKPQKPATPQKPVKEIPVAKTTPQNNELGGPKTTMAPKVEGTDNNEVNGNIIDIDEENNELGNGLGQKDNPEPDPKNFWDMLFSHPAILAGLVGAVVLALLTVVLLLMFIVYRIKKKDEGSYSLDEPHKVKDPMAYWKDTKEFYA